MKRASLLALLIVLSVPTAPVAAADVNELVGQLKRWLWPMPPAPQPPPPVPPKTEPPPQTPLPAPPKTEPLPRVEMPVELPRPVAKPKPKRRPKPVTVDEGPDLPWPCWIVRLYATGRSEAELDAIRIANGVPPLSPKQRRQAQECLAGVPRVPDRK
jgi:outer membrane biosynthesis protein TonB